MTTASLFAQIAAVQAASARAGASELADAAASMLAVPALIEAARAVRDTTNAGHRSSGPWLDVEAWTRLRLALSHWDSI